MNPPDIDLVRRTLLGLLAARTHEASLCPSEVARALAPEPAWRALMPSVVAVARDLARRGTLRITQGTAERSPDDAFVGPIRLRRGSQWTGSDLG